MNSVFCKECGESLENLPKLPSGERAPCPRCGSTSRNINVVVSDSIAISEHTTLLGRREGKAIGFRESEREGRAASADLNDDGTVSYSLIGSSSQGEEDTLSACQILIRKLNDDGGNWLEPVPDQGVVDCKSIDKELSNRILSIQVVRAIVDQNLWKQLNKHKKFEESNITKEQLVKQLETAIKLKAASRKIPPPVRPNLNLALDATRLPAISFDDVVEEFLSRFGTWVDTLGFEAVWLVGPQPSLVWRLDISA